MESNEMIQKNEVGKNSTKVKLAKEKVERLIVKGVALQRLDGWLQQIEKEFMGIKLKRADLVEWLLATQEETLSADALKGIRARFYDDLQLMEWALKQAKEAKGNGKTFSIADIMRHLKH